MHGLSPAQARTLQFIDRSVKERGYPPTLREICETIGSPNTNAAHSIIVGLVRKGVLDKQARSSRGLTITEKGKAFLFQREHERAMKEQLG